MFEGKKTMPELEILFIALTVSVACVLPGVFLVLRGTALMSDAISHAILLGIVVGFLIVKDMSSPILVLGATLAGILTVTLTELLIQTNRIKKDAAIGLVFPVFFSIGVILITKCAGSVHLDTDAVLLGELAFAPFNRFSAFGMDVGPKALWVMGGILIMNVTFITTFYKELKLTTFDEGLAAAMRFSPVLLHYGLMGITSVTAVGAFDAVGSILVVALMITPPATAYLLTYSLPKMIFLSIIIGILASVTGYGIAHFFDASIAGSMATMCGAIFLLTLLFSPQQGLVAKWYRSRHQTAKFSAQMLIVQLLAHENTPQEKSESTLEHMITHMNWSGTFVKKAVKFAAESQWVNRNDRQLKLTDLGRATAQAVMRM